MPLVKVFAQQGRRRIVQLAPSCRIYTLDVCHMSSIALFTCAKYLHYNNFYVIIISIIHSVLGSFGCTLTE